MSRRYFYMIAVALILLAVSLVTKHFYPAIPDFLDGLLRGISIGILVVVIFNIGKALPKSDRKV